MGDTKAIQFRRGLKLARMIAAALTGLFFVVAFSQIVFFVIALLGFCVRKVVCVEKQVCLLLHVLYVVRC